MSEVLVLLATVQGAALVALLVTAGLVLFNVTTGHWSRDGRLIGLLALVAVGAHALLIPLWRLEGGDASAEGAEQALTATILTAIGLGAAWAGTFGLDHTFASHGWWDRFALRRFFGMTGGAVMALFSLALSGNSLWVDDVLATAGSTLVHGLAGAIWLGGIVGVARLLATEAPDRTDIAVALGRFSVTGALALLAVAATGVHLAMQLAGGLDGLTDGPYGRWLLAKLAVATLPVGMAIWNRLRLVPAVLRQPDDARAWAALRSTLRVELAGVIAVVVVTGFLALQDPEG